MASRKVGVNVRAVSMQYIEICPMILKPTLHAAMHTAGSADVEAVHMVTQMPA